MAEHHELMGGALHVYKRENSRFWQCSTFLTGKNRRKSTKEESLSHAKEIAEDWYIELRGKARAGLLKRREKLFREAADAFTSEYEVITEGQRSPKWVEGHEIRLRLHLIPFFGDMGVSEVNEDAAQEYRVYRLTGKRPGEKLAPTDSKAAPHKPPSQSTLHDEIGTARLVLQTAVRKRWLAHVPDLSPPYKTSGKIVHRPWFSPAEYKQLYKATGEHARKTEHRVYRWNAEQVRDYVLFMANTGLRPDEAMPNNLQHRDVTIVRDDATGERILEIEVRGKRGVGYCKSMPGAVRPYERLRDRAKPVPGNRRKRTGGWSSADEPKPEYPQPTDPVFPGNHIKLFNGILKDAGLKLDRDGHRRTAYSLRHTYICMRLMEGADIYQVAKNCRTSVEMIEKFYAAHIKNTLDAAAINVMRPRAPRKPIVVQKETEENQPAKSRRSRFRKARPDDEDDQEIQR
jgi:integrase